ncbi:TrmH family RNA methyltransferase [Algoriphagus sediminis]|uniref:RNA methyltransferase n=1 Tax=Algoriphagus sediminis TaxID=3057113 RepID=A0ABT7YE30_9BACT|nr:RNA methyltransferase [Algoriphagus sediminis]MDN3204787.1 RNA methyltransferase [Algoriphagus sediminis]
MLSKNTVKFIKTLHQKKYRSEHKKFFVEGEKSVLELLSSDFNTEILLATDTFLDKNYSLIEKKNFEVIPVTQKQLESIGQYRSNDAALAVVEMKPNSWFEPTDHELVIALDDVRDPGNLGTIIRIADWYGIDKLLLSKQTADFYNPKVIQSSMGSFTRVHFYYADLGDTLAKWGRPVYGAFLDGENIHEMKQIESGVILMGNESNGISENLEKAISQKVTIPSFGHAESLNVAIATAVLCDNFKRLLPAS